MSVPDRFWEKVNMVGPVPEHRPDLGPCWIWTGAHAKRGYGLFWHSGRMRWAYRWLYLTVVGVVPEGLELDHVCRTPACVRPDHLEPVTHAENMRRGSTATKTHCAQGHEFTESNTYRAPSGRRRDCRTCMRDRVLRHSARKRTAA